MALQHLTFGGPAYGSDPFFYPTTEQNDPEEGRMTKDKKPGRATRRQTKWTKFREARDRIAEARDRARGGERPWDRDSR